MHEIQKLLAQNLKRIRKEKGLHQSDIATKSGIIGATYSRIETCNVSPNLTTLISIAETLDVSVSDLFDDGEITSKSLYQKFKLIDDLSEYNKNVIEVMIDMVLEKDKLEKGHEIKLYKRLDELQKLKNNT